MNSAATRHSSRTRTTRTPVSRWLGKVPAHWEVRRLRTSRSGTMGHGRDMVPSDASARTIPRNLERVPQRRHGPQVRATTAPGGEVLAGLVERVTFHNPETGFCVLRIKARGHRDLVTAVGHAATISAGEWITASGRMDQRPDPWAAIPCTLPAGFRTVIGRRHRKISRLRHDPGHRPGLCQAHGPTVRHGRVRHHRSQPRSSARGRGDRTDTGGQDHRGLGGPEDGPRDHGVPVPARRRHGPRGAHLQDLRRRCRAGHERESLPAGPRHPGHRLPYRRSDRGTTRHREDGDDPGARRDLVRADRGHGRRPLRLAGRGADHACGQAARGAGRAHRLGARAGAGGTDGDRRQRGRHPLRVPERALSCRTVGRRTSAPCDRRPRALAGDRRGQGAALGRGPHRPHAGR